MRTWFEFNDMAWETPEWRINQVSTATQLSTNLALTDQRRGRLLTRTRMSTTENSSDSSTLTSDDENGDDKTNCPQPPNIVSKSGVLDLSAVSLGSSLNIFSANLEYQEPSRQIIKREIFAFYKGFTKCHEMRRGGEMLRSALAVCQCLGKSFSNKLEF